MNKSPACLLALILLSGCTGTTGSLSTSPTQAPVPSPQRPAASAPSSSISRTFRDFIAATVGPADTLSSLAATYLGDPEKAWLIARYNGISSVETGSAVAIPLRPFDRGGLRKNRYQTVPVLSYHMFSETDSNTMTVTRESFEKQMQLLKEKGYSVITLDDFYDFLDFKRGLPEKSVVITFDDGWRSIYEIAFPILRRYDYPATLFISTAMITGSATTLTWDQIREMSEWGMDMQSHSVDHRNLIEMKEDENLREYLDDIEREIALSADIIRKNTGQTVSYLAYPYGTTSPLVVTLLKKSGYRGGLTVKRGGNPFFTDNFRVNRSMIYGDLDLKGFEMNLDVAGKRAVQ